MSHFDIGSKVVGLVGYLAQIEMMTSVCVILLAASNVASIKFPEMTKQNSLTALEKIDGKLDQILTTPLNMAIEYYETVINAVMTGNFRLAFEQLQHLIGNARWAFH